MINEIHNEDCLHTMSKMDDEIIDLVITSPPYDNLREYNGYSFDFEKIANELKRILKPGGVIVWVVGDATINGSETGTSFRQALYFKEIGLNLHDTMIYQKHSTTFPDVNRYNQIFEYMFIFSKGKPKTTNIIKDRLNKSFNDGQVIKGTDRQKDGTLKSRITKHMQQYGVRHNIWKISSGYNKSTSDDIAFKHPAIFPEQLVRDHIVSWSNEMDLVYDPFMGSGTTAKISHLLKRNWIGSEISEQYVKIAQERLKPYIKQLMMF